MTAQTIAAYLPEHPFFAGLDPATLELAAGCAVNVHFKPGALLFREGDPADVFYVLRHGRVAIQMRTPTEDVLLDTAHEGDVVGWSWLVPPYRWTFDAVATEETSVVSIDGACLRGKCEADHELGYQLMRRFAATAAQRLQATRLQLLDVYGHPVAR